MHNRWIRATILLLGAVLVVSNVIAQNDVRLLVINEFANIRTLPAIGATVIDTVEAGYVFETIEARNAAADWIRVQYNGQQGWVNLAPLQVRSGNIEALPVADPRSIPYGGSVNAPRAGFSNQQGNVSARATAGLRVRSGPSTAYPTIDNIFFNEGFTITGQYGGGTWLQVNYDGTLGWVSSEFVEVIDGDVTQVPVDGIVAQEVIPSGEAVQDYYATLRLMLDRVNLAQPSLNQIRASWTDSALTGRASCSSYPPRPSDFPISQPLLSAYYPTLQPLQTDFNDAVFNIREAIDLFIEVCNQPGTGNPVGEATVQGALNIVNTADAQFESLRQRLNELIPPNREPGPDECLLIYNGKAELLPLVNLNVIYLDEFTRRNRVNGYCFNGVEDMVLNLQTLPIPPAELQIFVSVSPLDNPEDFIVTSPGRLRERDVLGPIRLPRTTTYAVIMADLGNVEEDQPRVPLGNYAFRITNITFALEAAPLLDYDPELDSVILTDNPIDDDFATSEAPEDVCPGTEFSCQDLFTCDEARACLQAGNFTLDEDGDGIPCEATLCTPNELASPTPGAPTASPTPTATPTATQAIPNL